MLRLAPAVRLGLTAVPGTSILRAAIAADPPRRRARGGAGTSVQGRYAESAGEAATIVVVEDDPSVLRALSRLIQAAGFRVMIYDRPSALLASEIPKANACAVIDINLPEMNGSELCRALAASGRGLPAVLMTGRSDLATQRLIDRAHPVAALFKPFDERTLFDAIAKALALPGNSTGDD